jgi:hypothetical protein
MVEGRLLPCNQVSIFQFMQSCQDLCQRVLQLRLLQVALRKCSTLLRRHTTARDPCTVRRDLPTPSTLRPNMATSSPALVSKPRWHLQPALAPRTSMQSTNRTILTRASMMVMVNMRVNTLIPVQDTAHGNPRTLVCLMDSWVKCTQTLRTFLLK